MMNWRIIGLLFCLLSPLAWAENSVTDLIAQSKTYLREGQYYLALDSLRSLPKDLPPELMADSEGTAGLIHYQQHQYEKAAVFLKSALHYNAGSITERVNWLLALAELTASQEQDKGQATQFYKQAGQLAALDKTLQIAVQLGQVALLPKEQQGNVLQAIYQQLNALDASKERTRLLIHLGSQAMGLGASATQLAYNSFQQAKNAVATSPRLVAEALGSLAQLYEDQTRAEEALALNDQALQAAQEINAHDLLLELEWRQGRLQKIRQHTDDALAAYQRAVDHIEAIRLDIPVEYDNGYSTFRRTLAPIYLELADLLLQQASSQQGESKNKLLRRARDTVELIKQSEMEDFLGGRCAVQSAKTATLENVAAGTAVIYPILLENRLELLVSTGDEIQQFTQSVSTKSILYATRTLASYLRNGNTSTLNLSQKLYHWLIAPIEPWLNSHHIQTLVIVPDSILRLISLAALHDGEHYLIEKYAIVTSPGLTLFAPIPLQQRGLKTLLAGLSEPGSVIDHLPSEFLRSMSTAIEHKIRNRRNSNADRALSLLARPLSKKRDTELLRDAVFRNQLKTALSLPGVNQEIKALQQKVPNFLLMNDKFTLDAFKRQVGKEQYSMIHIASHGVFGGTADTSFIMAYDNVLNIDELESILKSENFEKNPLELLTLSACQTAEGDDRAPLGLSGIAIKAKVRSALGSLWSVNDEATSKLMGAFYTALAQPNTTKAQALRLAQLTLLKDKQFTHPFFWSAFILVGNWL